MTIYYHNEGLFSEIYLEEITRQPENVDSIASLKVLREFHEYADKQNLQAWKESFIYEVLSALGFFVKSKTDALTDLFEMRSNERTNPVSLCYVVLPDESLDNTTIGRNWAEKIIRALRNSNLQWGLLTNGNQWRIYHLEEPTPYETFLEINLEAILLDNDKESFQIFYKFMKADNFTQLKEGNCQFDIFKKESQDKIDYIEKELANALKQREEGGKGVLSDLCMGYIEELRKRNEGDLDDENYRKKIYHSAMLYMFRLLFLFYADARNLLSEENHNLLNKVETQSRMHRHGSPERVSGFSLWESLEQIFVDIDQTYNGGLFSPQESEFTAFLSETHIEDNYLANVLFNLTTYHEKSGEEKPISYRDMNVRHLGTLYEGILEHKLYIAKEDTEVKIAKGKVQFIPASQDGKILHGKCVKAGEVYFSGDPYERKSSGSYFTPENIVDYIVTNTVGEKLKAIVELFLKKQIDNRNAFSRAIDEDERQSIAGLIEENLLKFIQEQVLKLSVLDPAMGSGHFLVNSTNLISNKITELLNELDIKGQLESSTSYWRRWVVENCIYGVDINALAVELAKLSLWILSMAKDQPLSFLKHHLKCGNSLIGANLNDIGEYPFANIENEVHQLSLFQKDPNFVVAVNEAISKSKLIASRSSTYRHDVEDKKTWLDELEQGLAGYKAICNVHTGLFFDTNSISENAYSNLVNDKNFLLANQLEIDNQFFNWELEFPMILLLKNGFDCVIGNPPYVDVLGDRYIDNNFTTAKGKNLYNYFVEKGLRLLNKSDGILGFIIPISIITSERMQSTRSFIREFKGTTRFVNIDSSANPGTLFDDLKLRLSITFIGLNECERKMRIYSSDFTKFFNAERNTFIPKIQTVEIPEELIIESIIPKVSSLIEISILRKVLMEEKRIYDFISKDNSNNVVFYKANGYNYMLAFSKLPYFEVNGVQSSNSMTVELLLKKSVSASSLICLFPTSLFYWFWTVYSDCFHFSQRDLYRFPINLEGFSNEYFGILDSLAKKIEKDLENNAELVTYNKAKGPTKYFLYRARYSKPIFDQVDDLLGKIFDFSSEELDFIKNYDLRFRTDERE